MRANKTQAQSYSTFDQPRQRHRCCLKAHLHSTSNSVVLVLIWAAVVGFINSGFTSSPYFAFQILEHSSAIYLSLISVLLYMGLAITQMCYPLGGFLADVYFGRYKTVIVSLVLITVSVILALIVITVTNQAGINPLSSAMLKALFSVGGAIAVILLSLGLAGFQSNVVQFGLDQLQDSPSRKLAMFLHMLVWAGRIGDTIYHSVFVFISNFHTDYYIVKDSLYSLLPTIDAVLIATLLFNCFAHRIFNKERVKCNPYRIIFRILNFARKHKQPVGHPSAFAYCDTFKPTRMDYAKERYGGPFTTLDVEDVKTFIRVFLLLIALGPVFVIGVPTSFYLFSSFGFHTGTENETGLYYSAKGFLLQRGILSYLLTVIILPIYTWLFFSVLSKKSMTPKILHRILFAVVLYLLSLISMIATDITGHILLISDNNEDDACMFFRTSFNEKSEKVLNLHWSVLILPNLMKIFALDLIMASTFEFISAQSPHTMKGVLVGLLFAVRGFFQLIEAVLLFPFSVKAIWEKLQLNPHLSCGTSYYVATLAIALLGMILFVIAVKKYQYRKREEEPYSQSAVEEIYDRILQEREQRRVSRINFLRK